MADDAGTVIGNAVEEENPAAVGIPGPDSPTAEKRSIGRANVEILAGCPGDGEGDVGFADEIGRQLASDGMEEGRPGEPSGDGREQRREEQ